MKLDLNDILIRPIISEKVTSLQKENKYVFQIHQDANKKMVEECIKKLYNMEPVKINIIVSPRKKKRQRYKEGYTNYVKKAVITLKEGDSFSFLKV